MDVLRSVSWQPQPQRAVDVARALRRPTLARLDWSLYGSRHAGRHSNGGMGGAAEDVYVLHSRQCSTRVKAKNLARDRGGYVEMGPCVAVPLGYQGWFRILYLHFPPNTSIHTPTTSCSNITEVYNQPGVTAFLSCAVIKGFQAPVQGGDFQQREFPAGTVLSIEGAYKERVSCGCISLSKRIKQSTIKYLKCYLGRSSEVLIPMDCKGVFWPLGSTDNIQEGCVYQIQHLMDFIRESPGLVVELVHGKPPPKHEQFSHVLQLDEVMRQEVIVGCRITDVLRGKHPTLLEFPVHSLLSFYLAINASEQKIVKEAIDFVSRNLWQYMRCIKVITTMLVKSVNRRAKHVKEESPRNAAIQQEDETSFGSDTFTDYDTIPCDDPAFDPVYENGEHEENDFLQQTAQRLREELAKRAVKLSQDGGTPTYAVVAKNSRQNKTREDPDNTRLDSFLATTLQEMQRTNPTGPAIRNNEAVTEFLDDLFDCDVMSSSSTRSGAVLVATDSSHGDTGAHHSSISSLYKKVKSRGPSHSRRSDSGFSDVVKCSTCSNPAWEPPLDMCTMSVQEVGKALKYIGLRAEVVARFMEEQIDGRQLHDLEEDLLREAFPQMNRLDIKKLIDFKAGWRPKRDHM